MKKQILALLTGILLIGSNAFAADGDFIIEGNVGIGTETPTAKLDVNGNIRIKKQNGNGVYIGDGTQGLVWKGAPAINYNTLLLGGDDRISELAWDTQNNGAWAYCEGVTSAGMFINCADYDGVNGLGDDNHYWVWKSGYSAGGSEDERDLIFLFDGESNDGVMAYLEDEDSFIFVESVGIGTVPGARLHVADGDIAVTSSGQTGVIMTSPNGSCWRLAVDDSGNLSTAPVTCP